MLIFRFFLTVSLLCLVMATELRGDISLPKIFSDHMVVQRNSNLRIWGTAEPDENLTVRFGDQSVVAVANQAGNWITYIKTGAAGGPFELEVASAEKGGAKVLVSDILVGDVWLCGGQINMETPISELEDVDSEITDAKNHPLIRLFKVQQHQANRPLIDFANVNPWLCCSSDSIKNFSATGFLFGKELNKKLNIPIGLIDVSRDGIPLEAWTPYKELESSNQFKDLLAHWKEVDLPNSPFAPGHSFNAMIAPLSGFPMAGVTWFQGEANVGRGAQYAKMFPLMIKSWRNRFGGEIPFLFAQPAPFRYENFAVEALPELWDAQLKTFKSVASTGMVVTADLADRESIKVKNKKELASRLAMWAIRGTANNKTTSRKRNEPQEPVADNETDELKAEPTAGDDQITETAVQDAKPISEPTKQLYSGPIYESSSPQNGKFVISFRFAAGLKLNDGDKTSFLICGKDKKFYPAVGRVENSKLIVSSDEITEPVAVRYAWQDTAKPTLTNSSGLPASPFRTDDFPLNSDGVHF